MSNGMPLVSKNVKNIIMYPSIDHVLIQESL